MAHPSYEQIEDFMAENQGVASVADLAEFLDEPESTIRDFARDHGVRRLGTTFAFDLERSVELVDFLGGDGEEDDEDDEDDEDGEPFDDDEEST